MRILLVSVLAPAVFISIGIVYQSVLAPCFAGRMSISLSYLIGMFIIAVSVLLGIGLDVILVAGLLFIVLACYLLIRNYKKKYFNLRPGIILVVFLLTVPFLFSIVFEPLTGWDARSIWFFHGKMIYYQGALTADAGLQNPGTYAHSDYPKLIPILSAYVVRYFGFWNEYLPKLCLFLLLLGFILVAIETKYPQGVGKVLLLLAPLMLDPSFITNGYVDLWLGAYGFMALLSLINYYNHRRVHDLEIGLLCGMLLCQMKNEGMVLSFIIIANFFIIHFIFLNNELFKRTLPLIKKRAHLLLLAVLPVIVWIVLKNQWMLPNDLGFFSPDAMVRLKARLFSETRMLIYDMFIKQRQIDRLFMMSAILFFLTLVFAVRYNLKKNIISTYLASFILPFGTALLYSVTLFVTYLVTPFDVKWHLSTSIDRTAFPVVLSFVLTLYPVFNMRTSLRSAQGGVRETNSQT